MKQYHYADGLADITFAEGMIRLNLFHYGTKEQGAAQGPLPKEVTSQLVLPPAGFLRAFEAMQQFVEQMERQGIITKSAAAPEPSPHNTALSPNFQ